MADAFEQAALLVVPFIVLAETRVGALSIKRGDARVRILGELLQQPGVRVAKSTDATTHHDAALYARLKKYGTPIPTNDIRIAALAVEHSLVLYTRDARFNRIPSIPGLTWPRPAAARKTAAPFGEPRNSAPAPEQLCTPFPGPVSQTTKSPPTKHWRPYRRVRMYGLMAISRYIADGFFRPARCGQGVA